MSIKEYFHKKGYFKDAKILNMKQSKAKKIYNLIFENNILLKEPLVISLLFIYCCVDVAVLLEF